MANDATSGTGPTEIENSMNSPGLIPTPSAAVHVMESVASFSVNFPSVTGGSSVTVCGVAVQPGIGISDTLGNGWSVGSDTLTDSVLAVADSFGTRKVSLAHEPAATSFGFTETCANATPAPRPKSSTEAAVMTPARRARPCRDSRGRVASRVD